MHSEQSRARIARFGIGLAAVGRPAYINLGRVADLPRRRDVDTMRRHAHDILDTAYAAGIRWIDAARSYGHAEEFLGGWLRERQHADVTVSSKWGYTYVGDWSLDADIHEVKEHSLAAFERQLGESTRELGRAITIYQVHSLTQDSPLFTDESLLDALAALGTSGIEVGFSTSGPRQADTVQKALELEVAGQPIFTTVQSTWNVLEPTVGPALAAAHAAGAHVLIKEPLANGRLVTQPPPVVSACATEHGTGTDAVALAAALAQPWADTVLLGPASADQLRANLAASTLELSEAELGILEGCQQPAEAYWARRSELAWQ